jgi:hypothetical protein
LTVPLAADQCCLVDATRGDRMPESTPHRLKRSGARDNDVHDRRLTPAGDADDADV